MLSLIFGLAAGLVWMVSAFFSYLALRVKLDLTPPRGYESAVTGILIGSDDAGNGAFTINGMSVPKQEEFAEYQRRLSSRNAAAAACNAVAALLASGAAALAFFIS